MRERRKVFDLKRWTVNGNCRSFIIEKLLLGWTYNSTAKKQYTDTWKVNKEKSDWSTY